MGSRERELTRGISSTRKMFKNLILFLKKKQGRKQKIRDWVGAFEQAIMESRQPGSEICENRRSGILWARGVRNSFETQILFLKQKTRDESRISGTRWLFLSEKSW